MIAKLPGWVGLGAGTLAFVGGMVNVVGFLGFEHQAVTHLTGTTTMLGAALAEGQWAGALRLFVVIGSFFLGAMTSGFLIQDSTLKLGRRYGVALVLESALLFAAVPLLYAHRDAGSYLASFACGLQNAMATTFSGSVIRTTHLSGMFTDLGIFVGHRLRGIAVDQRRRRMSILIIATFFAGSVAGAAAFMHWSYAALCVPGTMTGLMGLGYFAFRWKRR